MNRRRVLATALVVGCALPALGQPGHKIQIGQETVDIFDLSQWSKFRNTVRHPATVYKAEDLARAKRNIARYQWARRALERMEAALPTWWGDDGAFLEKMIPATTPGAAIFTMCPHCEYSPTHGQYDWDPKDPDKLTCRGCGTVYPNARYPEDMVLEAAATGAQRFTYYGGKNWYFYGHHVRSSWTGQIRARKVSYMASQTAGFAKVHALTGKMDYARTVRRVLLRFAEVYPNYLVYSGYGEYADLDPRIAAVATGDLPTDELNLPPNKPNRKLHPNSNSYWMCGRAEDSGGEGWFTLNITTAYDLTCDAVDEGGRPLYSRDERQRIERDLLLESTYLMMADPAFNNKSISNRRATALVGACLGDPMRVRFGLQAFDHMVGKWYLHDGCPGESPAYGHMTLNGIIPMSEGLAGYSDPPGFAAGDGSRIDNLDLYACPAYRAVFKALTETILPDLRYPAWADTYPQTRLTSRFAEITATRYPSARTLSLLRRSYGGEPGEQGDGSASPAQWRLTGPGTDRYGRGPEYALFHDKPVDDVKPPPPFALASTYWPAWKAAYLRIGDRGLAGTAVFVSSDWGNHHHCDALNLALFRRDHECLTDFGYLWDSPNAQMTRRTFAHNLVLIDRKDQAGRGRLGSLHLYDAAGPIQAAEMSSSAYPDATIYRRTIVTVGLADKGYAVADFFRVAGGTTHDLVYHGPNEEVKLQADLSPTDTKLYDLTGGKQIAVDGAWPVSWDVGDELTFTVINLPQPGEASFIGTGWGSRDRADTTTRVPYVVRRRERPATGSPSCFTTVYISADADAGTVTAHRVGLDHDAVGVILVAGDAEHWIFSQTQARPRSFASKTGSLETDGLLTVWSKRPGGGELYLLGGSSAAAGDGLKITHASSIVAPVTEVHRGDNESHVLIKADIEDAGRLRDLTLILKTESFQTGLAIIDAAQASAGHIRIVTRRGDQGFDPIDAQTAIVHHRSIVAAQ